MVKAKKGKIIKVDPKDVAAIEKKQRVNANPLHFLLSDGKIKTRSVYNVQVILEHDPLLKGIFKFNQYTLTIDVAKDATDGKFLFIQKGEYKDEYTTQIASYIEGVNSYNHILFNEQTIQSGVLIVAHRNGYNPVIDYFNEAYKDWDGKPRIYRFLPDYLGADQSPLVEKITQKILVAAVAKAYKPLTKCDLVLDLVGGQGAGKTTLLQKLAPLGYYTDQFTTFADKDSFEAMRNAVIVNDDEMTATNNSSFEELKKFVSMQEFEYRKAYGHGQEKYPKKFILCRTTNDRYYLKDKTGERRFLPVMVHIDQQKKLPTDDLTKDYIKQLWGEAVHIYRDDKNFSLAFTKDEEAELKAYRNKFVYTDDLEDSIADLMDNDFKNKKFIRNEDLALCLGISLVNNRKLSNKVQNVMVNTFGCSKSFKKFKVKENGKTIWKVFRGYKRPI